MAELLAAWRASASLPAERPWVWPSSEWCAGSVVPTVLLLHAQHAAQASQRLAWVLGSHVEGQRAPPAAQLKDVLPLR